MMNLVSRGGLMAMGVSIAAMIGSSMVARSIPYTQGVGAKQLAWLAHCAVIGCVIAPICLLGGPILTRAAWYTAGMVGGLSTVAVCAPSDQFLYMGGPLAMGLGVVFCASIGSAFLPPHHGHGGWPLQHGHVRGPHPVWGLPAVRHPEDYSQGRGASKLLRSCPI